MRTNLPGKDNATRHTPLGYEIIDGEVHVNEEDASKVRKIAEGYLSGLSLTEAAKKVGLNLSHASVKGILTNKRYLGDGSYPRILEDETVRKIEEEMERRRIKLGRNKLKEKEKTVYVPETEFFLRSASKEYDNPITQAEYVYSLIESEARA